MKKRIYTIGHSTRTFAELVTTLRHYGITHLIDVRSVPRSRHTPQFNKHSLVQTLPRQNIRYTHMKILGGLRATHKDSPNRAWRNKSFRGYADYMQTSEFTAGITQLIEYTKKDTVAIMCAEVLPWRCHRSLIGDALLVRGYQVIDIFDEKKSEPETLTKFAKVKGQEITYSNTNEADEKRSLITKRIRLRKNI